LTRPRGRRRNVAWTCSSPGLQEGGGAAQEGLELLYIAPARGNGGGNGERYGFARKLRKTSKQAFTACRKGNGRPGRRVRGRVASATTFPGGASIARRTATATTSPVSAALVSRSRELIVPKLGPEARHVGVTLAASLAPRASMGPSLPRLGRTGPNPSLGRTGAADPRGEVNGYLPSAKLSLLSRQHGDHDQQEREGLAGHLRGGS
jgi:hypothetical protein